MPRPIPLDPPVTIAARCAMGTPPLAVGCGAAFHQLCLDSGGVHRPLPFLVALLAAGTLVAGCGGSDKPDRPPPQPEPTGQPADFPSASGKTLNDLASMADGQGPDPGAQRVAPAQGGQPLRLRALRLRPQADHRRRGGALHRSRGWLRRPRAVRRPLGVAGRQAAVPERDGGQGPERGQVRLRGRRALQAQRQAGRRGDRQARRAPAGDQRLQRQRDAQQQPAARPATATRRSASTPRR